MRRIRPWAWSALPYGAVLLGLDVLESAWVALVLYQAGMIARLAGDRGRLRRLRVAGPDGRDAPTPLGRYAAAIVPGALAGPALAIVWPLLGLDRALDTGLSGSLDAGPVGSLGTGLVRFGLVGPVWPAFLLVFSLVNPVLEELYWRGRPGRRRALDGSDLLFAGYHALVLRYFLAWPWVAVACASLAGAAWIWRGAARERGTLWPSVIGHVAAAAGLSLVLAAKTGLAGP